MSAVIETDLDQFLRSATDEELLEELRNCWQATAAVIRRMARIVAALQERGINVSAYKASPFLRYLPSVAAGRLNAEILVRYGGCPDHLLSAIANLVPEDQRKLDHEDAKVQVLVRTADWLGTEPRELPVALLSAAQARQVFGDGRIRTISEQRPYAPPATVRRPITTTATSAATIESPEVTKEEAVEALRDLIAAWNDGDGSATAVMTAIARAKRIIGRANTIHGNTPHE